MGQNKSIQIVQILTLLSVSLLLGTKVFVPAAFATHLGNPDAGFNAGRLIEDESFVANGAMAVSDIQAFLQSRGSALASFTEGGKTAAEIIYDYTRGVRDPDDGGSGYWPLDITVHPGVVLVTIQKESSLITSGNLNNLNAAMGYGCPEGSGCDPQFSGFTNQVKYGAWQLYRNYLCANPSCSDYSNYKIGQTQTFTNAQDYNVPASQAVTFGTQATAGLYRYTPHAFNGNYNFWKNFRDWFSYSVQFVSQFSVDNTGQVQFPTLAPGQSARLVVRLKNVGGQTWQRGVVNLGTDRGRDRVPSFVRQGLPGTASGWLKENRVIMQEASVAPGQTATFDFWYTVPVTMAPGVRREYFRPVVDGIQWMEDFGIYWDVTVVTGADAYHARWITQNGFPTLKRGESYQFEVKLRNEGVVAWEKRLVNLGTDRPRDRIPGFIREGGTPSGWLNHDRIELVENVIYPGQTGTFRFWYTVPSDKAVGTYREYFRPVADFTAWLDDWGIYWDVTVVP